MVELISIQYNINQWKNAPIGAQKRLICLKQKYSDQLS